MPADQFWDGDPWLAAGYYKANKLRNQRKSEEMWLQGLYNYNAFAAAVGNVMKKKGTAPLKYLDEPIRVIPLSEEERAAKAEAERKKAVAYFDRLAKQWEKEQDS